MSIRKTKILDVKSITGITTVGIFTAGVTSTDVGTAGTSYIKGLVAHNTSTHTATFSMYLNKDTNPVSTGYGITANRLLRVDLSSNETFFFEVPYPVTLTSTDSISVEITPPESGGTGIGTVINVLLLGDVDI
jgi:hypothetical protein